MSRLQAQAHLTAVASDTQRVATLVESLPPDANPQVPGCPEWGVRELVVHLGQVHRRVLSAMQGIASRPSSQEPPAQDVDLVAWLRAGAGDLLVALDVDPDSPVWSFDPQGRTAAFWQRRQAMENLVHRLDAEQACDALTPVDAAVAADGVSEVFDTMVRLRTAAGALVLPDGAVRFVATDAAQEWVLGTGELSADISAQAADLLLALWKRPVPPHAIRIDGDHTVATAFLEAPLTP